MRVGLDLHLLLQFVFHQTALKIATDMLYKPIIDQSSLLLTLPARQACTSS